MLFTVFSTVIFITVFITGATCVFLCFLIFSYFSGLFPEHLGGKDIEINVAGFPGIARQVGFVLA